jgi:hypothetical protein
MMVDFDVLVERYIDGALTNEERALLDRQCSDDPQLKERLMEALHMEHTVRARGREQAVVIPLRPRRRMLPFAVAAAAAVLFVTVALVLQPKTPGVDRSMTWGGGQQDRFSSVVETADGGLILGGGTYSFGSGDHNALLVGLSHDRSVEWQKVIGDRGATTISGMAQCTDGTLVVAGMTSDAGLGNFDQWVAAFNPGGDLLWQKALGSSRADALNDVVALGDGSVILVGTTSADLARGPRGVEIASPLPTPGYNALTLTAVDSKGSIQWQRIVDPSRSLEGSGGRLMVLRPRAVYARESLWVCGNTDRNGRISTWLARFTPEGELSGSWEVVAGELERGSDLAVLAEDRVVLIGGSVDAESGAQQLCWHVVDTHAGTVQSRGLRGGESTMGHRVTVRPDGSVWIAGQIRPGDEDADGLIVGLDADLELLQAWTLPGDGVQRVYGLVGAEVMKLAGSTGAIPQANGLLLEWTTESKNLSAYAVEIREAGSELRSVEVADAPSDLVPKETTFREAAVPKTVLQK